MIGNWPKVWRLNVGLLLISIASAIAQESVTKPFTYTFQVSAFASTSVRLPFWQTANQFGTMPTTGNTIALRQAIHSRFDSTRSNRLFYGAEAVAITGKKARIVLPELYGGIRLGPFEVWAGRRKQIHGLVDTLLSSGSISWSGNGLPLPQVAISLPNYTALGVRWLAVKGHFSHGWFGQQDFVKNYFLHQKSLYVRLGKPNARINLYGGLLHHVQWGGRPIYDDPKRDPFGKFYRDGFAKDWFTYGQVVFPYKALQDTGRYNYFEISNRFGNHLGQIDLGGQLRLKQGKILVYKQTFFETGQTFSSLSNVDDGLYGISFANAKPRRPLAHLTFEFISTVNQGKYRSRLARLLNLPDRHYGEQSFYFNHMQYYDGWSYQDYMLGSPFMIPQDKIRDERKSDNGTNFLNNNRIKAYYVGMTNCINDVEVTTRFSKSLNYGAWGYEVSPASQQSFSITNKFPLRKRNAFISVNISIDQGDLIRDNYGSFITYLQSW